jgi:pyruvate formate lyase activating enzyme
MQGQSILPAQIVAAAKRAGSRSIAYTYTEPTVFFEYAYETAQLARENGLANLLVTNGYMTREAWDMFHPWLDAANVDLKGFRESTYRKYAGARLQPILDNMKHLKQQGVWLEVTTLVIPGINDDPSELQDAAIFVARELGSETPWHISRFFPAYQMTDVPPTPLATLQQARQIGRDAGLAHVYLGNVQDEASTFCPGCGELLIRRTPWGMLENRVLPEGCCPNCGADVAGIGMGFQDPSTGRMTT